MQTFGKEYKKRYKFAVSLILPPSLAVILLISFIYLIIIPSFEKSFLDSKRSMIKELTNVAWSIVDLYEQKEKSGLLSLEDAQQKALAEIERLRYGDTNQNYFWVCDLQPKMVMHPYSKELIGKDLRQYKDSHGKRIFLEFIRATSANQDGYLFHTWHTKYSDKKVVSKLSYVKKHQPWGWIVGTGVFLDDVQLKTEEISDRLTAIALGAVLIFSLLLFYIGRQSLAAEKKRRIAEAKLKKSREKYKTLVETATEPIMMILDGKCIYSNSSMGSLLGYTAEEIESIDVMKLFPVDHIEDSNVVEDVRSLLSGGEGPETVEISMLMSDGRKIQARLKFFTKLFGDEHVLLMTARDLSRQKRMKQQLGESREQYKLLTSRLPIGIFRTTSEKGFRFLEANLETLKLFGLTENDLMRSHLADYLDEKSSKSELMEILKRDGLVKEKVISLKDGKGRVTTVALSLVLTRDSRGKPLYLDGIVEDVTKQKKRDQERDKLIVELQTAMMFLNQPVGDILGDCVDADFNMSVLEAAQKMVKFRVNALLIKNDQGIHTGIITDLVLRERVVAENISLNTAVQEVMSSPIISVDETAMIFEAILLMNEKGIKHLGVKDAKGKVVSVISNEELLEVQRFSTTFLINEINEAADVEQITVSHSRLPRIVKALIDSGVHAKNITRIITSISDAVFDKVIAFALAECGEPPVRFAFVSLGSEGRGEQTLATDQDNAVIFEDVPEDRLDYVTDYFAGLSSSICTALDRVGYDFCKGNIMAMNPKWCQPLDTWKEYFSSWVAEANPQDLMEVGIFFDLKCRYGDWHYVEEIKNHISKIVARRPAFFHLMAENTLLFKIPLDFFGNISVESGGVHADSFNIKHVLAMIVGFARIYAIKHSLDSTNTLQRLELLRDKDVLSKDSCQEIVESYNYLMQIRFRHQVGKINMGEQADNFVTLSELTHIESDMLKKIFSHIGTLRKKLSGMERGDIFF